MPPSGKEPMMKSVKFSVWWFAGCIALFVGAFFSDVMDGFVIAHAFHNSAVYGILLGTAWGLISVAPLAYSLAKAEGRGS